MLRIVFLAQQNLAGKGATYFMTANYLYYEDNLEILRRYIKDETIDLIYLDPPFNSNQNYNILFAEQDGSRSAAQIKAFGDTWKWDQGTARAYEEVVEAGGKVSQTLQGFRRVLGNSDMLAYLVMIAPRLKELQRVLKSTGCIYLHCDPTASHYLKILMDAIFGPRNLRNEIIWHYKRWPAKTARFQRMHDVILFYGKNKDLSAFHTLYQEPTASSVKRWRGKKQLVTFDEQGRRLPTQETTESEGVPLDDVWDVPIIAPSARERLGYPTQKPEALLERIIRASSNEDDIVLDPFCGCGTAIAVAQRLDRHWIGIDITSIAINLIKTRLLDTYGESIMQTYKVRGEPTTFSEARALAEYDKYQFQWWALGLVGARGIEEKKGADAGIDGRLYFHDEESGKTKQVIFSVKGGHTSVKDIRDLRGVIDREEAEIGVLIALQEPTRPMLTEATQAGFYESHWGKHSRLQILTIADLLNEKRVDMPPLKQVNITFKKAPKARNEQAQEPELPL